VWLRLAEPESNDPLPPGRWRDAGGWSVLRLGEQPDPEPVA
jgi:hypothetical protein